MRTIEIPEELYEEAASRAAASGVSVGTLVAGALESLFVEMDEDAPLTPEQLEIVAKADAEIDAGIFYTPEQVGERLAATRAAWIRENTR